MQACAVIDATTAVVKGTTGLVVAGGKLTVGTVKTTGKVVGAAGELVGKAGQAAKNVQTVSSQVADIVGPARIVKLYKVGSSMYADTLINKRVKARLLLDTGATDMQISSTIAKKLGIRANQGTLVPVTLAGGNQAVARSVVLKQVKVGPMRVKNVDALILENDSGMSEDGLLGMSYLENFEFKINSDNSQITLKRLAK